MSNDSVQTRLDLIAAKAKQLSMDVKRGALWGGDLQDGLSELRKQIDSATRESGR